MSDSARKGLGDQVQEKITPDSQKSTTDKVSESASGLYDRAAGAVQPEENKSATQKLGDSTRSGTDDASRQGSSILDSAKDTANQASNYVSDTVNSLTGNKK